VNRKLNTYSLATDMLSSPVCDLAPELQTSEIPERFMKHSVQSKISSRNAEKETNGNPVEI
jgi:hypothetical protein